MISTCGRHTKEYVDGVVKHIPTSSADDRQLENLRHSKDIYEIDDIEVKIFYDAMKSYNGNEGIYDYSSDIFSAIRQGMQALKDYRADKTESIEIKEELK